MSPPKLLVIGAVPPPSIGPTVAMRHLLDSRAFQEAFEIMFLDISDRRKTQSIGKLDLRNCWMASRHIAQGLWLLTVRRPDLVYLNISQGVWGYIRDLGFMVPALLLRKRVVIHLRGSEFRAFYCGMPVPLQWVTRQVLGRVAGALVLGQRIRSAFTALVPEDRIRVVPNGIDYCPFDRAAPTAGTREDRKPRVLFLSNLRRRKGIFEYLRSIPLVRERIPDACFTVAGEWRSREEEEQGAGMVSHLVKSGCVRFTGPVSGRQKIDLFSEQEVFVFTPVEPEGLPWVILEAMSAALPVVTSDRGAIADVVEDERTGFIVEPDPAAIAEKVIWLLAHPAEARAMGRRGRERIERFFSEEMYVRGLVDALYGAIARLA